MKRFVVGVDLETGKTKGIVTSYDVQSVLSGPFGYQLNRGPVSLAKPGSIAPLSPLGYGLGGRMRLYTDFVSIPCGHCLGCRLEYSRQWANRLMLELEYHDSAYFVTLTYDEDHAPVHWYSDPATGEAFPSLSLEPRDVELFLKRLRKKFKDDKIRYYIAGEYGETTFRPHYHAIIFGLHLSDLVPYKRSFQGFQYYTSESLSRVWSVKESKGSYAPLGYAVVAPVTWETCAYTARYVTKKLTGPQAEFYTLHNLVPEFAHMSRDGGIGKQWYLDHPGCAAEDYLFLKTDKGGRKFRPPKYYQSMFELEDPEMAAEVKERRRKVAELALEAELRGTNLTYLEYLAVKEAALKARTKSLVRSDI